MCLTESTPGIPPSPEQLSDSAAILEILHCHCRGLDRVDAQLLKNCYWPEAEVDYGSFVGPAHTFADVIGPALSGAYELTRHCIGNVHIQVLDDTARVESYVNATHLFKGGTQEMRFEGRYLDTLEKRDSQWKMIHRKVVMDWSNTREFEDERESDAFAALAKGTNNEHDPSLSFFKV